MRQSILEKVNWDSFDASKVDARLLRLAKGACLVEYNSHEYVRYLKNVFAHDQAFCKSIETWGAEERSHGEALARWAKMADSSFDFEQSLESFNSLYSINTQVSSSIRGSRTLELVARCLVETGTSTYYTALADASEEPLLKQICRQIAAEEVKHYTLFLKLLPKYQAAEKVGLLSRVKMAISRSVEAQDAELTTAYSCGNRNGQNITTRELKSDAEEFISLSYRLYQQKHLNMVVKLASNAVGLTSSSWFTVPIARSLGAVFGYQRWMRRNIAASVSSPSPHPQLQSTFFCASPPSDRQIRRLESNLSLPSN